MPISCGCGRQWWCFTDDVTSLPASADRPRGTTKVIEKQPADFRVARLGIDWDAQLALDPERDIHSIHLYRIWLEKSGFVEQAMRANPFKSTHFVWVDYGCFREEHAALPAFPPWEPLAMTMPPARMLVLNISSLDTHADKRIGGTILGGDRRAWRVWTRIFYRTLAWRHASGDFVGDDQTTMTVVAERHTDSVCIVQPRTAFGNAWFHLQAVLDGKGAEIGYVGSIM